jgi:hypothetical protein
MPVQIPNAVKATQNEWRFCRRCLGLFWNGLPHNGHCPHPDGGPHLAESWDFYLLADPDNSVRQEPGEVSAGP